MGVSAELEIGASFWRPNLSSPQNRFHPPKSEWRHWWQNQRVTCHRKSCRLGNRKSSTRALCQYSPSRWRTTLRSSSTAATTKNSSRGSRLLTGIATWFLRMWRRCGLKYQKQAKERRNQSQSTKIGLFLRCFWEETRSFLCWKTH